VDSGFRIQDRGGNLAVWTCGSSRAGFGIQTESIALSPRERAVFPKSIRVLEKWQEMRLKSECFLPDQGGMDNSSDPTRCLDIGHYYGNSRTPSRVTPVRLEDFVPSEEG
jgi:hypothetical protein